MARNIAISITIKGGAFQNGMRKAEAQTKASAKRMGATIKKSLKGGFDSAKKSANDMWSSLKGAVGTAATLGGAISAGALITEAANAEEAYISLSNQLTTSTGLLVDQAEAQAMVERAADKSKTSIQATREAMNQLAGVGDLDTIEDALSRSALQAKRLGVEQSLVARTTSRLLAKGVAQTAEEAELLIERMNQFGRSVLGVDPDEAIDPMDMAEFAAFTKAAGAEVNDMTTLLSKTGDAAKDMGQAFEIIEELGLVLNTRKGLANLRKAAGLSRKDINAQKGTIENMLAVLEKGSPRAVKALQDALATDRAKAAFAEILGKDLSIKLSAGRVSREELRNLGRGLRDELQKAADDTALVNRINDTNAKLTQTSGAKFQDAMNNLTKAMSEPEMVNAINTLADNLPKLAEHLAEFLAFVVENPGKSAAGLVMGKVALAFGSGAITAAGVAGFKALFGGLAAKLGLGAAVKGVLAGAGAAVAGVSAGSVAAVGAAAGGTAVAVGAESKMDRLNRDQRNTLHAVDRATRSRSISKKKEALRGIEEQRQKLAADSTLLDLADFITSPFNDGLNSGDARRIKLEELALTEKQLKKQLERLQSEDRIISTTKQAAEAMATLARTTKGASRSSRGPQQVQDPMPGAASTAPGG